MKLLAVDIGNTNLTLGLFADGSLAGSWRATTRAHATPDEMAALCSQMLALGGARVEELDAAAIASVVPPLTDSLARALVLRAGVEAQVVDAAALDGVLAIEIDRPAEAGADRLCNALAAKTEFGGPAIVVDLGTSTNFDLVSAEGAYVGGAIAPGLGLSLEALVGRASKLPKIELRRPPRAIGTNTVTAIQSGILYGYGGLVEGLLQRLKEQFAPQRPLVLATGGMAQLIAPFAPSLEIIEPHLTLQGLRLIYDRCQA